MHQHVLLYIKHGLKSHVRTFSPVIIIEDQYLQTFLHTLDITKKWTGHRQDWGQIHSQLDIYFEERLSNRNL